MNDPHLHVSAEALRCEEYHSEIQDTLNYLIDQQTPQYAVYKRIFKIMWGLASIGKVILVGRASVCLTKKLGNGIHVRLVASEASRIKHTMQAYKLAAQAAKKKMLELDKEREKLAKVFFNQDLRNPELYDFVFNTDQVTMDDIATTIIEAIQTKAKQIEHMQNR